MTGPLASIPVFQPRVQASWNVPFDLRPDVDAVNDPGVKVSHVKDQQGRSACTAYAAMGVCETMEEIAGRPYTSYSENFNYWPSRELLGLQDQDTGSTGLAAMTAMMLNGVATESAWPSADYNVNTKPSAAAYADGLLRPVRRVEQIVNIDHIPCALAEGLPIYFEMRIPIEYESIVGTFADQYRAYPSTRPFCCYGKMPVGSHAQQIMGNIPALEGAMVEGSWGPGHGDQGFFLLPYTPIQRGDAYLFYVVREFNGISIGDALPDPFKDALTAHIVATFGRAPFTLAANGVDEIEAWRATGLSLNVVRWSLTQSGEFKTRLRDLYPDAYAAAYGALDPWTPSPPMPVYRGPGDY